MVFTDVTKRMPSADATSPPASSKPGIGADQRFCTKVILFHPTEPVTGQCQYIIAKDNR